MQVRVTFSERANFTKNVVAKKLFKLMADKETNLALSADVTKCSEVLRLADSLGSEICVLKTHVDILEDFTIGFAKELQALAEKHNFLIFEDRKFADIGNTVKLQYEKGIYQIVEWADIVNAHSLPGPGIVRGLAESGIKKQRGLLLLAEMSSKDNLFSKDYIAETIKMAEANPEFVIGFIAQHKLSDNPGLVHMTPGVKLKSGTDSLGQQYITPKIAITQNQSDIAIVGRGIIKADDPKATAMAYREACWASLL